MFGIKTEEITDKGLIVKGADGKRLIEADTVVLAVGDKPNRGLYDKLFGKVSELYIVGDCVKPRKAMEAISEGTYVGLSV